MALYQLPVANRETFVTGSLNVTLSGVAEQLPSQLIPEGFKVIVAAKLDNTDVIYIGNSKANAEDADTRFAALKAGDWIALRVRNLNQIWATSAVTGEGISWIVEV